MERLTTSQVAPRDARWHGGLDLIAEMRRQPGITRAEAARRQGLSSGSATDIVSRLRRLALVDEVTAPSGTRGRPTSVLVPHRAGPVVLAIDLRRDGWQSAYAAIDGEPEPLQSGALVNQQPRRVVARLATAVARTRRRFGTRLRAVSVAVAGVVQGSRVVQFDTFGWQDVDFSGIVPGGLPLLVGNDATLAGVAEARRGASSEARTSLHLSVLVGIGGILVVDGVPAAGATGAGGEFGHLPFSDPSLQCHCGARGCWDLDVDGRALARLLGDPAPADPYHYTIEVVAAAAGDDRAEAAVAHVASALGRGVAGLVNAHDPEVVTLGGLGPPLVAAAEEAFQDSYRQGLMHFRRESPPPILAAAYRDDGPLRGAIELALDLVLCEPGLSSWSAGQGPAPSPKLDQVREPVTGGGARQLATRGEMYGPAHGKRTEQEAR
jgi:predicted NBD/HSP70 family sugar kinase